MGIFETAILLGALVLAGYAIWTMRTEYPANIQSAAGVLAFGITIVLWRRYVDLLWYWDVLALVVPLGIYFGLGARTLYQMGKVASDDKSIAFNNLIKNPDFSDALSEFQNENYEKSVTLFEELANQGNEAAQYNLGIIFETGVGELRDDHRAEHWYRKSAENGLPQAQFCLASILAADYMQQAEDYGYKPDIGNTTLDEREQKFLEAYKWLLIAKQAKHPDASSGLRRLRKNMTKAQIAAAERMAENEQSQSPS